MKNKTMNAFRAASLAEGFQEGTQMEQLDAWQYLIDTGLAWQLEGWFGRVAKDLIEAGLCRSPKAQDQAA